jgi:hypothetical protein
MSCSPVDGALGVTARVRAVELDVSNVITASATAIIKDDLFCFTNIPPYSY